MEQNRKDYTDLLENDEADDEAHQADSNAQQQHPKRQWHLRSLRHQLRTGLKISNIIDVQFTYLII